MPQPEPLVLTIAGRTDVGRARSRNEDSFGIDEAAGVALVCDGMGGHAGGDVASRTAAQAIIDFLAEFQGTSIADSASGTDPAVHGTVSLVRSAVQAANERLIDLNRARGLPEGRGMGTTVVGLCRAGDRLVAFHVGDSRLYRLRGGELSQLTRDHSLYQVWLDQGRHGPAPQRNIIMRALGTTADLELDVDTHAVGPDDLFLLCSDGLTTMLPDEGIAAILASVPQRGLDDVCERLVAVANERGGHDNITVVLARFNRAER